MNSMKVCQCESNEHCKNTGNQNATPRQQATQYCHTQMMTSHKKTKRKRIFM
jgi:hypothetical protein